MHLALDSETSGVDLYHGAKPYFVTTCDEQGQQKWWEWNIDPLTREPQIPQADKKELVQYLEGKEIVGQNIKFDVSAFSTILPGLTAHWPWDRTWDTLFAGHLLRSNQAHDLTTMALVYLGVNISPYELALEKACKEARRYAAKRYPDWQLAKAGRADMPSAKGKKEKKESRGAEKSSFWKFDAWLPRAIAQEENYPNDHPWWKVLEEYANTDSAVTLSLFIVQRKLLQEQGLWEIYLERLKLQPIIFGMEQRGVTINAQRMQELREEYIAESERLGKLCLGIAESYGYDLELPAGGNNKSLLTFCFDVLKLPVVETTGKGAASLNKDAMDAYEDILPPKSKQLLFVRSLRGKRKRDTSISYMEGYKRFALPCPL